jgi:hypothetical protein
MHHSERLSWPIASKSVPASLNYAHFLAHFDERVNSTLHLHSEV